MGGSRQAKRAKVTNSRKTIDPPSSIKETYGIKFTVQEHWDRFESLSSRKLYSTRFYDRDTTTLLGIDDDVRMLARNLGLELFIDLKAPTYARLTYEFLSLLEVQEDGDDNECPTLTFQVFNEDYSIPL